MFDESKMIFQQLLQAECFSLSFRYPFFKILIMNLCKYFAYQVTTFSDKLTDSFNLCLNFTKPMYCTLNYEDMIDWLLKKQNKKQNIKTK